MTVPAALSAAEEAGESDGGTSEAASTNRRVLAVLTLLGFAVPAVAYLWFIQHYAVNVVYADQWADLVVLHHLYQGNLSLGTLWAQHNENRMLFPNLLVLVLAETTHFNTVVENYIAAAMLFASAGLLIIAHRRRTPATALIWYVPVVLVLLSLVQFEDALWGFQVAWYMALLGIAATIYLLDREQLGWAHLVAAGLVAVVASFSSFEGLFVWPAGFVLLWYRRRSPRLAIGWLVATAATIVVYFVGLDPTQGTPKSAHYYALHHPLDVVRFFFLALGDVVGEPFSNGDPNAGHTPVMLLGIVIFAVAVAAIVRSHPLSPSRDGRPIGVSLICIGLLFAATIAVSRSWLGLWEAGASRYTVFDALTLVGSYLVLVVPEPAGEAVRPIRSRVGLVLAGVVAVCLGLQIGFGVPNGVAGGRTMRQTELLAADVSVDIDQASQDLAYFALYPKGDVRLVYQLLPVERAHHLSLFDDPAAVAYYQRIGVYRGQTISPP